MKSYNHLYEKTISETNRRYALSQAKHSKRFRKIMKHRHMSDDAAVEQSLDWIVNYENAEHVPVYIYDGITRKERTIIVPTMEELLVQHCIVIERFFENPSCTRPREKLAKSPKRRKQPYSMLGKCCLILGGSTAPIPI